MKTKIALVGNLANNHFREGKALQNSEFIYADLFFNRNTNDNTRLPESDEPHLLNNYPEWIYTYSGFQSCYRSLRKSFYGFDRALKKLNADIIEKLNTYDLCIFSGDDVCLAPFVSTKTLFRSTGADLTVYPIFSYEQVSELYPSEIELTSKEKRRAKLQWNYTKSHWKKAILSCDYVDGGFGKPFENALKKIKYPSSKTVNLFRLSIDTEVFKKRQNKSRILMKYGLENFDFIIFLPSRFMMKQSDILIETGQWKASDKALYGYKLFLELLKKEKKSSIALLIPDRSINSDLLDAKKIVEKENMSADVIFLKGENSSGFSRDELIDLYSISDVVMDDFGAGWYGSIVVEAMSCEVPVITYSPESVMEKLTDWNPIQNAQYPEEIGDAIFKIYSDQVFAEKLRTDSRKWVMQFHSNEAVKKKLEKELKDL